MMRQPTPLSAAYAWHRKALLDGDSARHDGAPQCGWFKARMVKNGPWVAVEIRIDRAIDDAGELEAPESIYAIANGNRLTPQETAAIWTYLRPISREEHAALVARIAATPAMHNPYQNINVGGSNGR